MRLGLAFVVLVMNERGAREILSSKVKLGAEASAAAGPVGRTASAETDATLRADILSYSRARGAFAGVALEGSTIRPDNGANKQIYGREIPALEIVLSEHGGHPGSGSGNDFNAGFPDSTP
jgi:lipid-binding SYLF domain-containing protein